MSISIEQIKDLREATGVSMMACKSALEEANGDFDKAIDILRKKGEAKAADRAARTTSEGAIFIRTNGQKAAAVTLLCETDFVSRSDSFLELGGQVVDMVLEGKLNSVDQEVPEITDAGLKLGENVRVGELTTVSGENIGTYVHSNLKIGVIVVLEGGNQDVAKDIAMHIAATNPQVVSPDEVSDDFVVKEKEIWKDQLAKEGKPAEIVDKIMMGKEKKLREEHALITQPFVKNPEQTVGELVASASGKVVSFTRFQI